MQKLYSVQYLRAAAALLVVIAHAFSHQLGVGNPFVVLAGQLGVLLFFVISGFIMVYISGSGPFSAPQFLWRRAVRIVPLYWLFTGLAALLAVLAPALFKTTTFTWPHFLKSLFFIVHEAPGRGGTSPLLSLGWTLNYEVYFYLAFAALAVLAARLRIVVLTVAFLGLWLLGLLLPSGDPVLQFYLNVSPLGFAAGCWIGYRVLRRPLSMSRLSGTLLSLVAVAGLALALADQQQPSGVLLSFAGQLAVAISVLVLGLSLEAGWTRQRLLERLGDASYAIYLTHMFVIGGALGVGERVFDLTSPPAVITAALVCIVLAVIAGVITHEIIEKPLLQLFRGHQPRRAGQLDHQAAAPAAR
ncbi:MAG TPA: acyltransferase [Devosia sp.]|nr:acyltransferase [Devosia sp.]